MAFKMKGFNPGKGTGMNKAAMKMAKMAMKKQKDYIPQTKSRKNIESDITPQSIKKDKGKLAKIEHRRTIKRNIINPKKSPNTKKKFPDLNKDGKITQADVLMGRGVIKSPNKMKKSPMKKMDSPATQAKIKKMIIAGIEKGMDDRDIRNKINQMSDGSLDYIYNRKTKKVTIKKGGSTGFEGFDETDPDKG
tara:strand:- start:424 stop:999 length:576 start_codon:yes stop_codon:yes gene_type:complete